MAGSGESNVNKALRRTRRDSRDEPVQTVGYQTETGDEEALTGDEHAPYVYALARATTDGSAVNTADKGEPQFLLCDTNGKLYVIATPDTTAVQMVEGDVAHDSPDSNATNFPVKIGGRAVDGNPSAVAAGDRVNALFDLLGRMGILPWVRVENEVTWVADAALAAAGAFTASSIVDVSLYRRLGLKIRYAPGAAGGYPQFFLLFATTASAPAIGDDDWYVAQINDGSVTATLLTGNFPAGVDVTIAPEWGSQTLRQLVMRLEAGDATTDRLRLHIDIDIAAVKYMALLYAEEGVTGTPGTFGARYSLSTG